MARRDLTLSLSYIKPTEEHEIDRIERVRNLLTDASCRVLSVISEEGFDSECIEEAKKKIEEAEFWFIKSIIIERPQSELDEQFKNLMNK